MNNDRFKNFDADVRRLVLDFEKRAGSASCFFDSDQLQVIADYYLEMGDVEGLEEVVGLGEHLYPDNSDIRLRKAQLYGAQGNFSQAMRLLKVLEREDPDDTDVSYSLGALYSAMGKPSESIQYFLKAAADGYELGTIYGNVADEYEKMKNTSSAVHYYRKALEHNPDEKRSLYSLASIWDMQGRDMQAEKYFRRHVEEHPYCKEAWFCLGDAYMALGLYEKAIDAFEYALAIDKTYYVAYLHLFSAYSSMNKFEKAVRTLHDALDYTDDRPFILYSIGSTYLDTSNYHTASVYFREAVKEDPSMSQAWCALGECSEHLGYLQEAVDNYRRAIDLDPGEDSYWLYLADFHIRYHHYAEAITVLGAFREATFPLNFYTRLAYCYFKQGHRDQLMGLLRESMMEYGSSVRSALQEYPEMADDAEIVELLNTVNNADNDTNQ